MKPMVALEWRMDEVPWTERCPCICIPELTLRYDVIQAVLVQYVLPISIFQKSKTRFEDRCTIAVYLRLHFDGVIGCIVV